jgi:hypothetical protein
VLFFYRKYIAEYIVTQNVVGKGEVLVILMPGTKGSGKLF